MRLLAFDVETTTINKGDPYHPDNRLVQVGFYDPIDQHTLFYKNEIHVESIRKLLYESVLIGANLKFDLAWMERIGIDTRRVQVFDVQLAEFIISNQSKIMPALDYMAEKYLGQHKVDNIKANYWDKGIDTWFIPEDELTTYLKEDLRLTFEVFKQQEVILKKTNRWNLFKLQCLDLPVLNNMEWNGIPFEKEKSVVSGKELTDDIDKIKASILRYSACPSFNCASGDHISCLLYGGTITHEYRLPIGVYKSGAHIGEPRYRIFREDYVQPQLVTPLKGSELKKEGYWSTDEQTLSSLKPRTKEIRELIQNILKLSKLEKLRDTYYFGIPKLIEEKGWQNNLIHGKLNQTVARTGRLSASEPNQQNFDPRLRELCRSEYD